MNLWSPGCSLTSMAPTYTLDFSEIGIQDVPRVGGKNASLGQLFRELKLQGVGVLDGFATTADAYWRLLTEQDLKACLDKILSAFNPENLEELAQRGHAARTTLIETPLPEEIAQSVLKAYRCLVARLGREPELAVRSSERQKTCLKPLSPAPPKRFSTFVAQKGC